MSGVWFQFEAKRIQAWILSSNRLQELRGGSRAVGRVTDALLELARQLGAGDPDVLIHGGGRLLVRLPGAREVRQLAEAVPWWVQAIAPGLSFAMAAAPAGASVPLEALQRELERDAQHHTAPAVLAGPIHERTSRTGLPAAEAARPSARAKAGLLDDTIAAKLAAADEESSSGSSAERSGHFGCFFEGWAGKIAYDVEDFGEGYVAVVQLDGNGVGGRLTALQRTPDRLRQFSIDLGASMRAAVREASRELQLAAEADEPLGLRPIVLGGDDLCLILRAEFALSFVTTTMRTFEFETRQRLGEALTAAAGVAFVKPSWPFFEAHELAEALCSHAKRAGREQSRVAFHRVTTASALPWEALRARELGAAPCPRTRAPRWLGGHAYTLGGMASLRSLAGACRGLPTGALREWLSLAREDADAAARRWGRLSEVQRGAGAMERVHQALLDVASAEDCERGDDRAAWLRPRGAGADAAHPEWTPLADASLLSRLRDTAVDRAHNAILEAQT